MSQLKDTLHEQATAFVDAVLDSILASIRSASLEDLISGRDQRRTKRGSTQSETTGTSEAKANGRLARRLARRSKDEILAKVSDVAALLKKHKDGLRSEQVQKELGLDKRETPRIFREGLAAGMLKVLRGKKRATFYGVGKAKRS